MKLPSYQEALRMGKEALDAALVPVRANRAKKQAELEMCKLDEDIATKQAALHEACTQQELKFDRIIKLQDEIALLERRKAQYQQILDQMFPAEGATS